MTVKKGQILELKISDLAFGGKGLAKVDGFAIFVDQSVPFDVVSARIIKKKKNFAEARIVTLLESSPFRVDPPCKYNGFCGGCKWQFIKYDKQLIYKRQHVVDSLERIGLIKDVPVYPVIPSTKIFGYRNKMEFSCSDRRWLLPDEMDNEDINRGFALGLHVPGIFHKVLDIQECLLMPELGNQILRDVNKLMINSNVPAYGLRNHIGFWRFLTLRHSVAHDEWMVNIITATEDRDKVQPIADLLMKKYPQIVSVLNNITSRKSGVAIGEYEIILAGAPSIKDKIGKFEFEISANSFFQTNTLGAERLFEIVKKVAGLSGKETVIDLYSGTGAITILLSEFAKEVIGMEIVESAVSDAQKNCKTNRVSNCRFILGDVNDCFQQVKTTPEVMIIDPPRVGMHKKVVKQILEMCPEKIVYVSCNPATMARDLCMMKEQYKICEVQPMDMFPHTYHIESVAMLERK